MRILITGATGLIGKRIIAHCKKEAIGVNYLTTSKDKKDVLPGCKGFYWNPSVGEIDVAALQDVSAIIHLAGASISERWTPEYKVQIIESRVLSGNLLFTTLQKNEHHIGHFISASGVNIYPSSTSKEYNEETTETATDFLGNVVSQWEAVANKFENLGLQVTKVRTGVVLDKEAGALPKLAQPIKLGMGTSLGSGKQWVPWIHVDDVAKIYLFLLKKELSGVFNAVAPQVVTNAEMTKHIAKKLRKPLWLPNVPGFVIKTMLGEMATLVLDGVHVRSEKIQKAGFTFQYPTVERALEAIY